MKKHIFAIFTYFATFFLSFFLVSFLTGKPQTKATYCFSGRSVSNPAKTTFETEQQTGIRNLLTRDQKFGLEYYAAEETAESAENLVANMKNLLDSSQLPVTVRKSYIAHIGAWENYAKHLKRSKNHDFADKDCIALNRDISETYNTLLLAAENYGVEFSR